MTRPTTRAVRTALDRLFRPFWVFLLLAAAAQATTVTGDIADALGNPVSGDLVVSWPSFVAPTGELVARGTKTVRLSSGAFAIELFPNEGASPTGTYYTVRVVGLTAGAGQTNAVETWVVPDSVAPVDVATVRTAIPPTPGIMLLSSQVPPLDASKITSGQFPIERLASGTPDGTKFVRDDGTLAVPSGGDWGDITGIPATFPPTAHAAAHQEGGADELAIAWGQLTGVPAIPAALSDLTGDSDDVSEGATNLYHTAARARAAISAGANVSYDGGTGVVSVPSFPYGSLTGAPAIPAALGDLAGDSDDVGEGAVNLYHTAARARAAISAGANVSYDGVTGVVSVPAFPYGSLTGAPSIPSALSDLGGDSDDVGEGVANLYHTAARARAAISGGANVGYDSGTGVVSVPSFPYGSLTGAPSIPAALGDLADVTESAPAEHDIVTRGPTGWVNGNILERVAAAGLTNGRVPFVNDGVLKDSTQLTYDGTTLTSVSNVKIGQPGAPITTLHVAALSGEGNPVLGGGEVLRIQRNSASNAQVSMTLIAGSAAAAGINFGDASSASAGRLRFDNATDEYLFLVNASELLRIGNTNTGHWDGGTDTRVVYRLGSTQTRNPWELRPDATETPLALITPTGVADFVGFRVSGTAPAGYGLRGNGTDFVAAQFDLSDLIGDSDDVGEGVTNLYHTTARARAAISAGANVGYDSGAGVVSVPSFPYGSLAGVPSTFPPAGHAASHGDGQADEIALDASQVTAGQFAMARLASGTPDGTKFIRDDGTLAVPGVTTMYVTFEIPFGWTELASKEIVAAGTLTQIRCKAPTGIETTVQVWESTAIAAQTTALTAATACTDAGVTITGGSLLDTAMAAGNYLVVEIVTTSGSPGDQEEVSVVATITPTP